MHINAQFWHFWSLHEADNSIVFKSSGFQDIKQVVKLHKKYKICIISA